VARFPPGSPVRIYVSYSLSKALKSTGFDKDIPITRSMRGAFRFAKPLVTTELFERTLIGSFPFPGFIGFPCPGYRQSVFINDFPLDDFTFFEVQRFGQSVGEINVPVITLVS
jgi:hypothetical protein